MITLRLFDHEATVLLDTVTDAMYAAHYDDTFGDKYTLEDIAAQLDQEIEDSFVFGPRAADELSYDADRYGRYYGDRYDRDYDDYLDGLTEYDDYGRTATAADVAVLTPKAEAEVPAEPEHVVEPVPLPEPKGDEFTDQDAIDTRIDKAVKAALWVEREKFIDALQELIERIYQS